MALLHSIIVKLPMAIVFDVLKIYFVLWLYHNASTPTLGCKRYDAIRSATRGYSDRSQGSWPAVHGTHNTVNLSTGGLAFHCERKFAPGDMVEIRVPLVSPPFEVEARVAWCTVRENSYEIGVEFLNQDDAFMAHMVEQVCLIENYKLDILRTEGRFLSAEDAAAEWISKYAARFPGSKDVQ